MKEDNYIVIQSFMINDLKLSGNELILYAIIYGFTQDGINWFYGTRDYLCDCMNTSKPTITRCLQSLMEKGLLERREVVDRTGKHPEYMALRNFTTEERNFTDHSKESCFGVVKNLDEGSKESLPIYNRNNLSDTTKEIYTGEGSKVFYPFATACLSAYNEIMGTTYSNLPHGSDNYLERMGEHYTIDQVRDMLAYYKADWSKDDKQRRYMNMQVLFGQKGFESYMQTAISAKNRPESFEEEQRRKNEEYIADLEKIKPTIVITTN